MTLELLSYLVTRGHTVSVYVGQWDDRMSSTYKGMTVRDASYLSVRIAHDHDVFITHPEVRIAVLQYVQGIPYVAIVHNVDAPTLRSLERQAPQLTIVGSQWTRTHMPDVVVKKGVSVCEPPICVSQATRTKFSDPNGPLVSEGSRPRAESRDNIQYDATMINLSLKKGGHILQYVAERLPHYNFLGVIGGHGSQMLDQPSNVTIQPHTSDMAAVYRKTRTLIFPTRSETYGIVVSEAMQYGIPVVASNIPPVREAGGDAAIYLSPYDGPSWVAVLKELEDGAVYRHRSDKSRARGVMLRKQAEDNLVAWEASLIAVAQAG